MAMIRTLAVTGVFLVSAGLGSPLVASAQTSGQGQAVGILFLLGASKTGAQARAKAPGQKPKPVAAPEAQAKIVDMKPTPPTVKDQTRLVRVGAGPIESTDRSNGKHN
jgi:hypothetical protein